MNIQMKHIPAIAALAAAALLAACADDTTTAGGTAPTDGMPEVTFSVGTAPDATTAISVSRAAAADDPYTNGRAATDTYFPGNETFYAYFPSGNTSVDNNTYTVQPRSGTNQYNEVEPAGPVLMTSATAGHMQCYMCYGRSVTNATASFAVTLDQSTADGYRRNDLMYALATLAGSGLATNSGNSGSAPVTFQHQMTKLIIAVRTTMASDRITAMLGGSELKMNRLSVIGGSHTITLNTGATPASLTDGQTVTGRLNNDDGHYILVANDGEGITLGSTAQEYVCLLPPQTINAGTALLRLDTNAGTIRYRVQDAKTLAPGYAYRMTLDANFEAGTDVEILDWAETPWTHNTQHVTASGRQFTVTNGGRRASFNMVHVEGGQYTHKQLADGTTDVHGTLRDFYIGQTEVTQQLYAAVMGALPAGQIVEGDDYPVSNISYNMLTARNGFIDKLNELTQGQRPEGYMFALPSNAQWEWAARGGRKQTTGDYAGATGTGDVGDYAWYSANADGVPHRVAQKRPNALGLYDMTGNVWEATADLYSTLATIPYYGGLSNDDQGIDFCPVNLGHTAMFYRGGSINQDADAMKITNTATDNGGRLVTDEGERQGLRLALVKRPKVGALYFSDGSYGTLTANSSGTTKTATDAIGVVFMSGTSLLDQQQGYYDGYVVALYLANGGSTLSSGWGKNDKIYTINNIPDEYNATNFAAIVADLDGLTHCKTAYAINGYSYTGLYAINAANAYGTANHTEAAAPAKSSGWYLPSIGQLYATVVNFSASSSYNSLLTAAYSTSNWGAQYNGTYGFALSNGSAYSDLKSKVNAFITAAGLTGQDGNAYAAGKFQQYFTNYYTWASTEAYADQAWYINWGGKLQLGTQGTQGRKKAVLDIYARPVLAF